MVLYIKRRAGLEEIALCEFLKHSIIVLGIVASDVPNLMN
jgi:hypothetical protein